jgi:hypothetical protein
MELFLSSKPKMIKKIIFPILSSMIFISCSTTVSSIEDFDQVELEISKFTPRTEKVLQNKIYKIFIEKEKEFIQEILKDFKNIEIVENKNLSTDFNIRADFEKLYFDNKEIVLGNLTISNNYLGIIEDIFPIVKDYNISQELQIFFSLKRGYILEKRINRDDEPIFKINLGKSSKLKTGDEINIYGVIETESFLSGEKISIFQKIDIGTISEILEDEYSWIYLQNPKMEKKITLGTLVILKNRDDFGSLLEDGKNFTNRNSEILENNIKVNIFK